jgi:hypothetical protein
MAIGRMTSGPASKDQWCIEIQVVNQGDEEEKIFSEEGLIDISSTPLIFEQNKTPYTRATFFPS